MLGDLRGNMRHKATLLLLGAVLLLGVLTVREQRLTVHAAACPSAPVLARCVEKATVQETGDRFCLASRGEPTFQAALTVTGMPVEGALGLPGEPVLWTISLHNTGTAPGRDLIVTVTPHPELRIEHVESSEGTVTISDRAAILALPELQPGESVRMSVRTTVLHAPVNGVLVTQVALAGNGPTGVFAQSAVGELFAPTGLPATGYPPGEALPGEGEPSVLTVGIGALTVVLGAAWYVWYRGRRALT
jgi:hypothetical protein